MNGNQIESIPIPTASEEQQCDIAAIVDKIIASKKINATTDVSEFEKEIGDKIYGLYGLTDDEIAVVEAASNKVKV